MKKAAFLAAVCIIMTALPAVGDSERRGAPQASTETTSRTWLRFFQSPQSAESETALIAMGEIYASKINSGVMPDSETRYGLGRILETYLKSHPEQLDWPLRRLVLEVLKDGPAMIEEHKALWRAAQEAAQEYFSDPSPANARKFYASLPAKHLPGLDFAGQVRLSHFIYDEKLSILKEWMAEGNADALDIGFRLINVSDGAFGEDLVYDLGQAIPKHPKVFLERLLANRDLTEPPVMELLDGILYPVGWWEMPENDPGLAKYRELLYNRIDARIRALESVNDKDLLDIRDRCLAALKRLKNLPLGEATVTAAGPLDLRDSGVRT